MGRPLVSVVMAVYNGGRYLREAVASVLEQTFRDFEFIIVDDGSRDDTAAQIRSFGDPRIRLVAHAENRGLTAALRTAVRAANGAFIARMDADDRSLPGRFETQLAFLERHPSLLLLGTFGRWLDASGAALEEIPMPTAAMGIRALLLKGNCFIHGSVMFRREAVARVGNYSSDYPYAQDYELWLRIASVGQVDNVPEALYGLRTHDASISATCACQQRYYAKKAVAAVMEDKKWRRDGLSAG